jgi:glycosyltransferase involved in cell wall biosynthesis
MKRHGRPYAPESVTLVTTVYIPELAGYWQESLDVLKVCLHSLFENTETPHDLLVWDNDSCREVREYLLDLHDRGRIQYLFLARENVAKLGCFNQVFPSTPGEYIGFFDSDVYFHPGWLEASLNVFDAFEKVGTVTARPVRQTELKRDQIASTLAFADDPPAGVTVERGDLIPAEIIREHFESIGVDPDTDRAHDDVRLTRNDVSVYANGSHFQFLTRRDVAGQVLPLPFGEHPLGSDRQWDLAINELGYLRLSLDRPLVRHIGNSLKGEDFGEALRGAGAEQARRSERREEAHGLKRRILMRLYRMISRALYS